MAKKKQILNNNQLYQGLDYNNFGHVTSNTIFSLGSFLVTSNFTSDLPLNNGSKLKSFAKPVTLETINVSDTDSQLLYDNMNKIILNSDNSDIDNFVRYGSAYEFLRNSVQNIILTYPASLSINSLKQKTIPYTINNYTYNSTTNESRFNVYVDTIDNPFNLIYVKDNVEISEGELKNLNLSYSKYVMWTEYLPDNVFNVVKFTGSTTTTNIFITVKGNPLSFMELGDDSLYNNIDLNISFHIKPNNHEFELFRESLRDYEKYLVSTRDGYNGFKFFIKTPIQLDTGDIIFSSKQMVWTTTDKYNLDISTSSYRRFLEALLNIGALYDQVKSDIINRVLTTSSIKQYDTTDSGKMTKLLRVYGYEFDKIRELINSLLNVNSVTYNKKNNIPDSLVDNLVSLFGWEHQVIVSETLSKTPFNYDDNERNAKTDLLPNEINTELWRRILINTNYFWKGKGTREVIKTMFLMLGIPEEFINITEYIYYADNKIDTTNITLSNFVSIPFDSNGYPVNSGNTEFYYYQMNGDSDGGRAYLNEYLKAGFDLNRVIDNRKSWSNTDLTRSNLITPEYKLNDSRLLINTKEIDVALEASQGIEYDMLYFYSGSTGNTLFDFYKFINDSLNKINIRDIKIADFYPTIVNMLITYYASSQNKYTFDELFKYLSLYDAYFNRFINALIPTTVIHNNVGITIRNTSFTRQKFQYRRGVYIASGTTAIDVTSYTPTTINGKVYLGNDNPIYFRKYVAV